MIKELIAILEKENPDLILPLGFSNPHSYRGYYSELGVEPATNVSVGEMIHTLESAIGKTYTGYKGGDYTMSEYNDVYLAEYGSTGEELGSLFLKSLIELAKLKQETL